MVLLDLTVFQRLRIMTSPIINRALELPVVNIESDKTVVTGIIIAQF